VARAAGGSALLVGQSNGMHNFHEARFIGSSRRVGVGRGNSEVGVSGRARAATSFLFFIGNVALRLLALEFAFGSGAGGGLRARPVALCFLAQRRTVGLRSHTGCFAFSWCAHGLALGARVLFAHFLGATNGALRLLAVHGALRTLERLALHLTFWSGANRVANGRAHGVVALPLALGVARSVNIHLGGDSKREQSQQDHD